VAENPTGTRRRKRRKTTQAGGGANGLLAAAIRVPWELARGAIGIAMRHRIATLGCFGTLVALWAIRGGLEALERHASQSLPRAVDVVAPTRALRESVLRTATDTLALSHKQKETREAFLAKLSARLAKIDAIDGYALRAGLDERLQVRVESQVPLFVLEGIGRERVLVGHRMRLLQRKVGADEHPHLLRISTPEIKVSSAFPQLAADAHKETSNATGGTTQRRISAAALNFAWLANQGSRIRALAQTQGEDWILQEIAWRASTGFSLDGRLVGEGGAQAVTILLGEDEIEKKMSKLPEVIGNLKDRGLAPATIDLDYGDKAIIRLSESPEVKSAL
jgi:hypothetical protein